MVPFLSAREYSPRGRFVQPYDVQLRRLLLVVGYNGLAQGFGACVVGHAKPPALLPRTNPAPSCPLSDGTVPFAVVGGLPTRDVHRKLSAVAADYEHVVIDTRLGNSP